MSGSVESLLVPPKLNSDQNEIYAALTDSVGTDILLQYPRSGAYRSSFITEDIDGDGTAEAIAFYCHGTDTEDSGALRINILDTDSNGNWASAYDIAGSGTAVDRVIISELGGSGRKNVIIGFIGTTSSDKNFRSYAYSGGTLTNTFSDSYSSIFITDIDKDGGNELSVIHPNNEYTGKQAYYSLILDDGASVYESSTVLLNDETSDFASIALGYVGVDTLAVFIDGLSDGQLSTEIIYSISGTLRNPLYLSESESIKDTVRSNGYFSTDIDLDGIIEIPTLTYALGYTEDSKDAFYITNWNVMDNFTITKKYSGYYSISDGYCFLIPNRWDGVVTIKSDAENGDIVFYKYRINILNSNEELMRIAAVTKEYYNEKLEDGYTLINSNNNIYYMYKTPENTDEPLILTEAEILNGFKLMI